MTHSDSEVMYLFVTSDSDRSDVTTCFVNIIYCGAPQKQMCVCTILKT